jgi:hypothetical protein
LPDPVNFKVDAYVLFSRYLLENKMWKEAEAGYHQQWE